MKHCHQGTDSLELAKSEEASDIRSLEFQVQKEPPRLFVTRIGEMVMEQGQRSLTPFMLMRSAIHTGILDLCFRRALRNCGG